MDTKNIVPAAKRFLTSALQSLIVAVASALLPLLFIFLFQTIVTFFDAPSDKSWSFLNGFYVSRDVYLLSLKIPLTFAGVLMHLAPLCITFLIVFASYSFYNRLYEKSIQTLVMTPLFAGVIAFLLAYSNSDVEFNYELLATFYATTLCFTGCFIAYFIVEIANRLEGSIVKDCVGIVLLGLLLVSSIYLLISTITGWKAAEEMFTALDADIISAIMLTLFSLMFLPNVLVWVASFAAGPGYNFGDTQHFAYDSASDITLPNIPMLSVLPDSEFPFLDIAKIAGPAFICVVGGIVAYKVIQITLTHHSANFFRNRQTSPNSASVSTQSTTQNLADMTVDKLVTKSDIRFSKAPIDSKFVMQTAKVTLAVDVIVYAVLLLLFFLANGALGTADLAFIGVHPLYACLIIVLELLLGELLVLLVFAIYRRLHKNKIYWEVK
ncbi:MAG: DUF6350 family protein [Bifidobacteriaceae bacterium]|jgi:hypothetical protein|nr:DUF6350 family protein [Bifidobacteriaceae bacterium]